MHIDSPTRKLFIAGLIFLVVIMGCGGTRRITATSATDFDNKLNRELESDIADAQRAAERCLEYIKTKNQSWLMSCFADEFFAEIGEEELTERLKQIEYNLGSLESYEFGESSAEAQMSLGANQQSILIQGTVILLNIETQYTHYPATEQWIMYRQEGEANFKIMAYIVLSPGLIIEEG